MENLFIYHARSSKNTHTNKHTKPDTLPQSTDRNTTLRSATNQTLKKVAHAR